MDKSYEDIERPSKSLKTTIWRYSIYIDFINFTSVHDQSNGAYILKKPFIKETETPP